MTLVAHFSGRIIFRAVSAMADLVLPHCRYSGRFRFYVSDSGFYNLGSSYLVVRVRIPLASSFSQRAPDQNTFLSSRSCHSCFMCFSGISTVASARARSQPGFSCVRASLLRFSAASNNCSIFRASGIGNFKRSPLAFLQRSSGFMKH